MEGLVGEIRMVAFPFVPRNWARCEGQLLAIQSYPVLYSILWETYGSFGNSHFALPDLRGRAPSHTPRMSYTGETWGQETVSLNMEELPQHAHALSMKGVLATAVSPDPAVGPPAVTGGDSYGRIPAVPMALNAVSLVGGGLPHDNMQPYLGINFIICVAGVRPWSD